MSTCVWSLGYVGRARVWLGVRVAMHDTNDCQPARLGIKFNSQMIARINRIDNFALRNIATRVKLLCYIAAKFADQKTTTLKWRFSESQLLDLSKY